MQLAAAMGRLGTESAFEVLARATRLQQQGRSIINLGIGQPDFPTPPHIVEAAVKALRDGQHGYTPANGILPLREAVAADMALRRGVGVAPDRIVIVPGGKVTMFMAIAMFGEPGAEIMYPDPGFPIYRSLIEWTGATPVPIALHESRGFAFSADEVLGLITPRTRLMIVNSPANPTGGVVPQAELDRLVAGLFGPAEEAAVRMEVAAPPPAMVAAPAFEAKDRPAALPERLLLDEKTPAAAVPSPQGTTEIVFAVNSSFLVAGDYAELRRFVASLPEQGRLRLAIAASVSDEPLRTGDEAAAGRYNRWLAGRRAERVADWLRRQLGKRAAIATELVPHDPSRRVTVTAWPAP